MITLPSLGTFRKVPLEQRIRAAFQPIVDIISGEVFAYEALVRGANGQSAAEVLSWVDDSNRREFDQACRVNAIRGELYPEDVLVCLAALRLRRPVKWIEDRREHLVAANHSRQQTHRVRAAVKDDGMVLAIDDEFFHDQGGYIRTHGATVPDLAAAMLPGPYRIPAYRARGYIRLTNKTPGGTYRSPGRYESTFVRERLVDAVAARLGIDAAEVRRRNFVAAHEMPFKRGFDTLGTKIHLDSGDYALLLDKAFDLVRWPELQASLVARRAAGERVGAGYAFFVEKRGLGPFDGDVEHVAWQIGHEHVAHDHVKIGGHDFFEAFDAVLRGGHDVAAGFEK